jgi:hypothetical protein
MNHRQYTILIALLCLISTLGHTMAISLEESIGRQREESIDNYHDQDDSEGLVNIQTSNEGR